MYDMSRTGYGVVEFENMECNVLECISEYRTLLNDRREASSNHHLVHGAKTEKHKFLARVNTKYMRLGRTLLKRIKKMGY